MTYERLNSIRARPNMSVRPKTDAEVLSVVQTKQAIKYWQDDEWLQQWYYTYQYAHWLCWSQKNHEQQSETIHYFWGGGNKDYSCSNEDMYVFTNCQASLYDTEQHMYYQIEYLANKWRPRIKFVLHACLSPFKT